jgi:stage V sporulation protein B
MTDTLWVLAGNIFNKILGLVSFTILVRSLGPEMYGVYSIAASVLILAGDLSDLGINSSLIRYGAEYSFQKDDLRLKTLFNIALRSRIVIGTIILISGILFSGLLANSVYHNELLHPLLIVAFSGVLVILLNSTLSSILTAKQQYKLLLLWWRT